MGAPRAPASTVRAVLAGRLPTSRAEIEASLLEHVPADGALVASEEPSYRQAMLTAASAALDACVHVIAYGMPEEVKLPALLAAQARRSARLGIGVEVLLRHLFKGHDVMQAVLAEHALALGMSPAGDELAEIRDDLASLLEYLLAGVAAEHEREREQVAGSSDGRRLALVSRVLAGEQVGAAELGYELDGTWHLGVVASGSDAKTPLAELAARLGLQLLAVGAEHGELWAWFASVAMPSLAQLEAPLLGRARARDACVALGAPQRGIEGWRYTHAQAQSAMRLARRCESRCASYARSPLLASALGDETLCAWLECLAAQLGSEPRGRAPGMREVLGAYIETGFNAKSAAAALGVSRSTLERRLADAEALLGRPLRSCAPELRLALELQAIGA